MERTMRVTLQITGFQNPLYTLFHLLYDQATNLLNFEAVCPLEDRNRVEYWGPFTQTHVVDADNQEVFSEFQITTDGHFYQFVIQMSIKYPEFIFIYRSVDFKSCKADSIVVKNGTTTYPSSENAVIHNEVNVIPYRQCGVGDKRRVQWSETYNTLVYVGDLSDLVNDDTLPQPIPHQNQLNSDEFLFLLSYDLFDEDDDDPHMDGASWFAFDQYYESDDSYEEDYGEEDSDDSDDSDDQSDTVTIQAFQGNLPDDAQCSVCLEVPNNPQLISCTHIFCNTCITQWLTTAHRCPLCRRRII